MFKCRYYYLFFLIICSIYVWVSSSITGQLWGDYFGFVVDKHRLYLLCFLIFYGMCFYYDVCFRLFSRAFDEQNKVIVSNKVHYLVAIFQISYLVFNNVYGLNVAGSSARTESFLKFIFLIINADYLFLIYFCFSYLHFKRMTRLFKFNFLIFMLSTISRGWFGFIPFIFMFYIYKTLKLAEWKKTKLFIIMVFGVGVIYLIPLLYSLRDAIRTGEEINLQLSSQNYFLQVYINRFIERFDFVSPLYFIFSELFQWLEPSDVKPVFMNGIFLSNIYSELGFDGEPLSRLNVKNWFGVDSSNSLRDTAFTSTLIPYFFIDALQTIFTFMYFHMCILILSYFSSLYKNSSVMFLNWYVGITLLIAGWAGAFLSFIITLVAFYLLIKRFNYRDAIIK